MALNEMLEAIECRYFKWRRRHPGLHILAALSLFYGSVYGGGWLLSIVLPASLLP